MPFRLLLVEADGVVLTPDGTRALSGISPAVELTFDTKAGAFRKRDELLARFPYAEVVIIDNKTSESWSFGNDDGSQQNVSTSKRPPAVANTQASLTASSVRCALDDGREQHAPPSSTLCIGSHPRTATTVSSSFLAHAPPRLRRKTSVGGQAPASTPSSPF